MERANLCKDENEIYDLIKEVMVKKKNRRKFLQFFEVKVF